MSTYEIFIKFLYEKLVRRQMLIPHPPSKKPLRNRSILTLFFWCFFRQNPRIASSATNFIGSKLTISGKFPGKFLDFPGKFPGNFPRFCKICPKLQNLSKIVKNCVFSIIFNVSGRDELFTHIFFGWHIFFRKIKMNLIFFVCNLWNRRETVIF